VGTRRLERPSPARRKGLFYANHGHQEDSNENGRNRQESGARQENSGSISGVTIKRAEKEIDTRSEKVQGGKQVQKIAQDQEGIARRGGL